MDSIGKKINMTKSRIDSNYFFKSKSDMLMSHFKRTLSITSAIPKLRQFKLEDKQIKHIKLISHCFIILNCIILCIDGTNFSNSTLRLINYIDFSLLLIFYIEIIVKLIFRIKYFQKFSNIIDFLLFLLNLIVQICLVAMGYDFINETDIKIYSLVRSFHILRIYRLLVTTYWKSISILITEIIKIMKTMMNLLIILIIILLLFTLIGRELFKFSNLANDPSDEEIIRINFNNFLDAFFANFLIFIGEEWHLIMFAHMKSFSKEHCMFFVINLIISTIFLNKIFLASLINNLIESKNMKKIIEGNFKKNINFSKITDFIRKLYDKFTLLFNNIKLIKLYKRKYHKRTIKLAKSINPISDLIRCQTVYSINENIYPHHPLKRSLKILLENAYFSNFMMFSIVMSLIILGLHDPYQPSDSKFNMILTFLDIPIFIFFIFELLTELIVLKEGIFTVAIFIKIFICFLYVLIFLYKMEILKLFLIIRLCILVDFSKELKVAFKALFKSLIDILQLFFFFLLVGILFALIGVKYFKGAFWYCDGLFEENLKIVITKQDCFDWGGDWMNRDFNFDNIFKALEINFFIANTEGWLNLM